MKPIQPEQLSALTVQPGIEQPPVVNPEVGRTKARKREIKPEEYFQGIRQGNRTMLGKAITLVESTLPSHQEMAQQLVDRCLPYAGNSIRVGITGVPGVGKSTFIETLGNYLTGKGHKIAVLAIDPSSQRSKGSILGDKTRMTELAANPNAFIRPSPSAGTLGGVARKTRETVVLCEAAGFDIIFIETVGVGQSETAVHDMVDFFLLLMLAGAGDELQGIKRGIMEMADAIVINKADGDNIEKTLLAKTQLTTALQYFPTPESGWMPKVELCSALFQQGIDKIWDIVLDYVFHAKSSGFFEKRRLAQQQKILYQVVEEELLQHFHHHDKVKALMPDIRKALETNQYNAYTAASKLLEAYFGSSR